MPIDIFILINAKITGLISGIFLCSGVLALSSKSISAISTTYWGYNKYLIKNLITQKFDFICGFLFLIISYLLDCMQMYKSLLANVKLPIKYLLILQVMILAYLLMSLVLLQMRRGYSVKLSNIVLKHIEAAQKEKRKTKELRS